MRLRNPACLGCVAAGVLLVLCQQSCSSTRVAAVADAGSGSSSPDDVITIGVSNSLTGGLSSVGLPLHNAWSVAERYVNAQGGVLGKRLAFEELDDGTDDSTASDHGSLIIGVAKQLIAANVAAVIGPNGSAQVETVQGLFFGRQILEVTPSATSIMLSMSQPEDGGRYLYRTVPADDLQGEALAILANAGPASYLDGGVAATGGDGGTGDAASLVAEDGGAGDGSVAELSPNPLVATGCGSAAVFYYDNSYGTPMEDRFEHYYQGAVVARVMVSDTVMSDYTSQVQTVLGANPDCLVMIVYDDVGDAFLRQLRAASNGGSLPFAVLGTDGLYDSKFVTAGLASPSDSLASSVAEGVYGTNPDTNPSASPQYEFFKSLYTAQYPLTSGASDIEAYASNEFDAAMLIALAIEKAGGVDDRVALRDAMVAISDGVGGVLGADQYAELVHDIHLGLSVDYAGASGPCVIDPTTGNVTKGGYIVWRVENGQFVTLTHYKPSQFTQ